MALYNIYVTNLYNIYVTNLYNIYVTNLYNIYVTNLYNIYVTNLEICSVLLTSSIINISRTLSSIYHELCHLNIKNSILSSIFHKLHLSSLSKCNNHLYVTNYVIYMSRTMSSISHKLYLFSLSKCINHLIVTNFII